MLITPTPSGQARTCLHGCGATVRRRFLPGHDQKLLRALLLAHREGWPVEIDGVRWDPREYAATISGRFLARYDDFAGRAKC